MRVGAYRSAASRYAASVAARTSLAVWPSLRPLSSSDESGAKKPWTKKPNSEKESKHVAYHRPWYRWFLGMESRKSTISDNTLVMFNTCAARLDVDPEWAKAVTAHNQSEMYAWFQSAVLHVWLCLGRMYSPAVEGREVMSQEMSEHLFNEVERRFIAMGLTNPFAYNREYKKLANIFHGTCVAYDKAYQAKDDEMFAKAIWRNLLNQEPEKFSPNGPSDKFVVYAKHQKVLLQYCDPEAFQKGEVTFAPFVEALRVGHEKS